MIASLRGTVIHKGLDHLVIECAGVGYMCYATPQTLAGFASGEDAFVYTTMIVREDAQMLFAFSSVDERSMFGLLQTVSGVATKTALGIMAVFSPEELIRAIRESDIKALQRANGVGKKVAERMALELRDKVSRLGISSHDNDGAQAGPVVDLSDSVHEQVTDALVGLGFPEAKAAAQVKLTAARLADADGHTSDAVISYDASTLLRQALADLGKK